MAKKPVKGFAGVEYVERETHNFPLRKPVTLSVFANGIGGSKNHLRSAKGNNISFTDSQNIIKNCLMKDLE